jgi:hypothetical protein
VKLKPSLRLTSASPSPASDMMITYSRVTLIRRLWLDDISHYLYVHWSNRNIIHVILFIDFFRKRKWNQVNTSFNETISNFKECQVTAW